MKVIVFGATGMVGQGALRECLLDPEVERVLVVGRTPTGVDHPKLREIVHKDLFDLSPIAHELAGYDACFFCLGVSSVGMKEPDYARMTYDLTMGVARTLARVSPNATFVYVSGAGTDSTEKGRTMWARVKGKTENDLLRTFHSAYMFRPGFIRPLHGIRPKAKVYRAFIGLAVVLGPILTRFPKIATTTEEVGRAMIRVAREGYEAQILESEDIVRLGRA